MAQFNCSVPGCQFAAVVPSHPAAAGKPALTEEEARATAKQDLSDHLLSHAKKGAK